MTSRYKEHDTSDDLLITHKNKLNVPRVILNHWEDCSFSFFLFFFFSSPQLVNKYIWRIAPLNQRPPAPLASASLLQAERWRSIRQRNAPSGMFFAKSSTWTGGKTRSAGETESTGDGHGR